MGSGAGAMLTDQEPGIPGGETPPSTAGGTPAATEVRFMGSLLHSSGVSTGLSKATRESGGRVKPAE
jgi:hypothetical protein